MHGTPNALTPGQTDGSKRCTDTDGVTRIDCISLYSWDRKNNPEPWTKMDPTNQQKVSSADPPNPSPSDSVLTEMSWKFCTIPIYVLTNHVAGSELWDSSHWRMGLLKSHSNRYQVTYSVHGWGYFTSVELHTFKVVHHFFLIFIKAKSQGSYSNIIKS